MAKIRLVLLSAIFGSVSSVSIGTMLAPAPAKTILNTPFVFPKTIPLTNWQQQQSHSLKISAKSSNYLAAWHYQYIRNEDILDINTWYEVRSRGDIRTFLPNISSTLLVSERDLLNIHLQPGIGFYHLFTYQRRAYLNSCINSHGSSTVTTSQFQHNRRTHDLLDWRLKERIIPWLQGRLSLKDRRCLWVSLSAPIESSSPEATYQSLEKVWFSWYQWWYSHFPQP